MTLKVKTYTALVSCLLLFFGVIWQSVSYFNHITIEVDQIKSRYATQKEKINDIEKTSNQNQIKISTLKEENGNLREEVQRNESDIKNILTNPNGYVTGTDYGRTMIVLHQDHQDVIKAASRDKAENQQQISQIYNAIIEACKK